jgi:hypothetical protein
MSSRRKIMKCQICGHDTAVKYNPKKRIVELLSNRSKKTQRILRNALRLISKIPSQKDVNKQFYFLQAISKVDEKIIDLSIHFFLTDEKHTQGKGFKYLQTIILNNDKDKVKLLDLEIKRLGRTPTKKEVKKKEYSNVYSSNRGIIIPSKRSTSDTISKPI